MITFSNSTNTTRHTPFHIFSLPCHYQIVRVLYKIFFIIDIFTVIIVVIVDIDGGVSINFYGCFTPTSNYNVKLLRSLSAVTFMTLSYHSNLMHAHGSHLFYECWHGVGWLAGWLVG